MSLIFSGIRKLFYFFVVEIGLAHKTHFIFLGSQLECISQDLLEWEVAQVPGNERLMEVSGPLPGLVQKHFPCIIPVLFPYLLDECGVLLRLRRKWRPKMEVAWVPEWLRGRPLNQEHPFWTSYEQEINYWVQPLRLWALSLWAASIMLTNTILLKHIWELFCLLYMYVMVVFPQQFSDTNWGFYSSILFFKLKYGWFIMFQVYSKVIQFGISIIFFFRFFSIIGYYKILNIVPCAIPIV